MNPSAGAAVPISIVTTDPQGNVAIPVYGYSVQPTDGRAVQGGVAIPVVILSASDLIQNGGKYRLDGRSHAMPVMTASAKTPVLGQRPIAVYPVNSYP